MIREIVKSTYDNYALYGWRNIPKATEVIEHLIEAGEESKLHNCSDAEERSLWYSEFLERINEGIDFKGVVNSKKNRRALQNTLFMLCERYVRELRKIKPRAQLEKELQAKVEHFSYRVSKLMVAGEIDSQGRAISKMVALNDFDRASKEYCNQVLPNDFPILMESLTVDDQCFWGEMYRYISRISAMAVSKSKGIGIRWGDEEPYLTTDVASDCYMILHRSVTQEGLRDRVKTPVHLKNNVWTTCRNILFNRARKVSREEISISEEWEFQDIAVESAPKDKLDDLIYDANLDDARSVCRLLAFILETKEHPLYLQLSSKIPNIDLFSAIYLDDLSYREVAEEFYPEEYSSDGEKLCSRLRKSIERTKSPLLREFHGMLNELRKNQQYEPAAL